LNLLSSIIRELRIGKNLTQEELAIAVGVSKNTVLNWEKAKRAPREKDLKALARVLGVSIAYLMEDDQEFSEPVSPSRPPLAYWADIVDKAREVAARRDTYEIAEVENMLQKAIDAVAIVQAELNKGKRLLLPSDAGELNKQAG
jgi:transcriptional regulator with XRE-family HTH domain